MTFVILSGGIDLSVGSIVAVAGVVLGTLLHQGQPLPIAMPHRSPCPDPGVPSRARVRYWRILLIARGTGKDAWDVFFDLTLTNASAMPQSMSEANKIKAMREDFTSFDTDAGPMLPGQAGHPRAYGAFARVLARYVRELGALSLEAAVRRASAVAANEIRAYILAALRPASRPTSWCSIR